MSGITCIVEGDDTVYHLNIGIRELRLPKGYRLNIAGCRNPGSATVEKWEQPWTGKGLPPVGTVCEWRDDDKGSWEKVRVCYLSKHTALLAFETADGDPEGAYSPNDCQFRPIRTPEQIAADERNAAEQALREIEQLYAEGGPAAVYDAGYRK